MNLVKNGAVLLAAVSMFAFTSCKNNGVSYEKALAWVKQHYKETEEIKMKTAEVAWNYKQNVLKDKLPQIKGDLSFLSGMDGNDLSAFALESEYNIPDASEKSGKVTLEHDNVKGIAKSFYDDPLNEKTFAEDYKDGDYKFYIVNNKSLKIVGTEDDTFQKLLKYTATTELVFDEKGYGEKATTTLHNSKATITIPGYETVNLGKMHVVVTITKLS